MTSLFGWFAEIIQWVMAWIPRMGICRAGFAGVRYRHGSMARSISPGLFVYWPLVTEVTLYPAARQTLNLAAQKLTTRDCKTVVVSVVVVFRINDIIKALVESYDLESTISDVALTASVTCVVRSTFQELLDGIDDGIKHELSKQCRKALRPYGIDVINAGFTDFAATKVIALAHDSWPVKGGAQ